MIQAGVTTHGLRNAIRQLDQYHAALDKTNQAGLDAAARVLLKESRVLARQAPRRGDGWPGLFQGRAFARRIRVERTKPAERVITARYKRAFRVPGTTKTPDQLFLEGGDVSPHRFPEKIIRPLTGEYLTFPVGGRWVRVRSVRQRLIRWPINRDRSGKAKPGTPWTSRHRIDIPPHAVFDLAWARGVLNASQAFEGEHRKLVRTTLLGGSR